MPTRKDYENDYNDDESFDMLDDDYSLSIKQEDTASDNYSVYSDEDRKIPAQEQHMPTSIAIKQESDTESDEQMRLESSSRDEVIPHVTPVEQRDSICDRSNIAIKMERMDEDLNQPSRKSKSKRKARRRLIYDEVSYFDSITNHDDDPDENFV